MSIDPLARRLRQAPRRKALYGLALAAAAAVVIFAANAVYGFVGGASSSAGTQRTVTVTRGTVQSAVTASGNVDVAKSASASFSTSGTVTSVKVKVGDTVKAGQKLATLDSAAAEANLETAKANLAQAEATLSTAQSGVTAEQKASNASSLHSAQVQLASAKQQLATDKKALADARAQLTSSRNLKCPPPTSSSSGSSSPSAATSGSTGSSTPSSSSQGSSSGSSGSSPSGSSGTTGSSSVPSSGSGASRGSSGTSGSSAGSSSSQTGSGTTGSTANGSSSTSSSTGSSSGSTAPSSGAAGDQSAGGSTPATTTNGRALVYASLAAPSATTGQATAVTASSATLGGSVNPAGLATTYSFQYGTSPSSLTFTTPSQDAGAGTGLVPVTTSVSGLAPGQSYWFRIVATNSSGTTSGELALLTTQAAQPAATTTATTGQASSVASTSATLNATVNPAGLDTTYTFQYGTSPTDLSSSTPTGSAGSGSSSVPVTAAITGLTAGQNYWFRVVATSSAGTINGSLALFTTASTTTSATTGQATSIAATSTVLSGTVNPGGLDTAVRFEYGTSSTSLTSVTPTVQVGSGTSTVPVTASLKGLKPNQSYWFRVVATNSSGTTNGTLALFTTGQAALASTGQASPVASTTATLNGTVSPGALKTTYYFEYGTSVTALGSKTAKADAGSGTSDVPVTAPLTGLKANTTYYFRLVATNSAATTDGTVASLTTAQAAVSATTGQATTVGSTTAEVTGTVNPGSLTTRYWFEYGTSSFAAATAKASAGSGSGTVSVTAKLTGLKPDASYIFRLVASNSSGTSTGVQASFTTAAAAAPTVQTDSATGTGSNTATLTGSLNANSAATTYWFEYGTTSSYGSKTAPVDGGSGSAESQVSALVTGLRSNTTYVFRLVARNAFGTTVGARQVLATQQSSCVQDAQTVADDEQTVATQEAAVTTAELNLAQVEASIAASETPTAATIDQDEASVKQAEATVAADRKALAETVLTAPIAGTITAVNGVVGSSVSAGASTVTVAGESSSSSSSSSGTAGGGATGATSPSSSGFVTLDSLHQLVVVAGFAEADAADLHVGQPATLSFPALTNTEVAGKVVAVSSSSTVVNNVVTYDATIALVNPPRDVKQGMTTDVSVATATRSKVLVLPTAAITTSGSISTVQLLRNGETTVTRVTTGLVGNSTTEIVSGLHAGDVVVEPTVTITASSGSTAGGGTLGGGGGFPGGGGGFGFPGG